MTSPDVNSSKKPRCRMICCVPDCESRFSDGKISFHRFPKPGQRVVYTKNFFNKVEKMDQHDAWRRALKVQKIFANARVCAQHFKREDYFFPDIDISRRQLKRNVVPSCNLPQTNAVKLKLAKNREDRLKNRNLEKEEAITTDASDERITASPVPFEENHICLDIPKLEPPSPITMCNVEVQVKTDFIIPKFASFLKTDSQLSTATGIESLKILDTIVGMVTHKFAPQKQHHNTRMSIRDKIILTYLKLKQNMSYNLLAIFFQCYTAKQCQKVVYEMIGILKECLKAFIHWPSRAVISQNLSECFGGFESARVAIGCTEIFTQHPKNLDRRIMTDSSWEKSQTIKFMTGVTGGNISYISRAYGGGASEKTIFEESDIGNFLETGDGIIVDRGFLIDDICKKNGWNCYRSPNPRGKKNAKDPLTNIAKVRACIERSNQRIKTFKILSDTMPTRLIPYVEDIFTVICATLNLATPVITGAEFMEPKKE